MIFKIYLYTATLENINFVFVRAMIQYAIQIILTIHYDCDSIKVGPIPSECKRVEADNFTAKD